MKEPFTEANLFDPPLAYASAPDSKIWDDFRSGSKTAYAYMYRQHFSSLYNYGYKFTQNRSLTEDCIQDIFLYILERRESLSQTDSIRFYLLKALRSEIVRRLKKQLSTQGLETGEGSDFHLSFSYESSWLEATISHECSQQLLDALNQLPARQKEAIFLRFYQGLSFTEIAQMMEVEQTSVYKAIYKGFAALQKRTSLRGLLTLSLLLYAASYPPSGAQ